MPVRLLWLIDSLTVGGAENLVAPFLRSLDRTQWDPQLCCLATIAGNKLEAELRSLGIPVTNLGARNLRDVQAFRRLVRLLREERIDLVHAHLTYASIWGALASRITGVPVVASLHVAPPEASTRDRVLDRLLRFVSRAWAARMIAVSEALRQRYLSGGGMRDDRFVTVHNGIEVTRFATEASSSRTTLCRALNIDDDARLIVTVSVLREGKGIEVLLEGVRQVVERIPNAVFLIVGDGPKRQEWTALAERLDVSRHVRWLGHRSDVHAILSGCDVFVLPSLDDAFPTVLLEAMAAALPIVATSVGGIPEIVRPGVTGTLVPASNAIVLANAIASVLQEDAGLASMKRAAKETAAERFSTEAWRARLTEVYRAVLKERGGRR